jgi:hypothetical protein
MATDLRILADYHQVFVVNHGYTSAVGESWSEKAYTDRIAVEHDGLAVRTTTDVTVDVTVDVLPGPPTALRPGAWVVEGSIEVASGRLVVLGTSDYLPDAAAFDVPAGWVRVRVSMDPEVDPPAAADGSDPPEGVRIEVWPAPRSDHRVLARGPAGGVRAD